MSLDLRLNQLAIHYIDKKSQILKLAAEGQGHDELNPTIADFLLRLVGKVWHAADTGSTRSGHFRNGENQAPDQLGAKLYIDNILQKQDCFITSSQKLAEHLYQQTPITASPGLLAIMQLIEPDKGATYAAILKIRHNDGNFVTLLDEALTNLEVEYVENMLLDDIQKGAIIPHPHKPAYDLKVIDRQAANDPAKYFTEYFLGCVTKKSDEHQVKRLLPELRSYAEARGLSLNIEQLPRLVAALQERETNVTADIITKAIQKQELFGPQFQSDDFKAYVTQESDLGMLDIPGNRFARRGKTGANPRQLTYHFRDPELRGITISGPPHVLANILHTSGDAVSFHIQTTKEGYDVRYE